jgi:hypothetical protein
MVPRHRFHLSDDLTLPVGRAHRSMAEGRGPGTWRRDGSGHRLAPVEGVVSGPALAHVADENAGRVSGNPCRSWPDRRILGAASLTNARRCHPLNGRLYGVNNDGRVNRSAEELWYAFEPISGANGPRRGATASRRGPPPISSVACPSLRGVGASLRRSPCHRVRCFRPGCRASPTRPDAWSNTPSAWFAAPALPLTSGRRCFVLQWRW